MIIDVTDLEFEVLNFPRSYNLERQKRGKRIYYNQGVKIKTVEKINEKNYQVIAQVEGTYGYYKVELGIENTMIKEYSCTCDDYKNGYICKHIMATSMELIEPHAPNTPEGKRKLLEKRKKELEEAQRLFLLRREEEERRREYQRKYADALKAIDMYKNEGRTIYYNDNEKNNINIKDLYETTKARMMLRENNPELATSIKLEPRLDIKDKNTLELSVKMGQTTKYVIKDIVELYDAFSNQETIQYGKKLRFIAKKENFCEEDQKLLAFLLEYAKFIKYNKKLNEDSYYYYRSSDNSKTIKIFEDKLDEFFEIMKGRTINISSNRLEQDTYDVTNDDIGISLKIEKNKEEYVLKINIEKYDYVASNQYIYLFYNKKVYSLEKNKELLNILNMFLYNNKILIPKDKFDEFSTYVLPKIEKYMLQENLPAEIAKEGLVVNKLASKIYLDLDAKENIILELKFCYLNCEFNILDKDYEKYVRENNIVRNIPEEKEILKRLFTDGFELESGKNYFVLKNLDLAYDFLSEKINEYMNDFEVLATDKFKNKKVRKAQIPNVSIKLDTGLLELDISKIDIDINEIKDILKNYNIKKKYYKLKNGDFLSLEKDENLEFLNDMQNSLDVNYDRIDNGIIKLPVNRSIYLEKLLNNNKTLSATKNDDFTKLINNIENKNFSDNIKINENFENILRDYQKTGYKWLKVLEHYKFGGILADDMGLGKTLQIIAIINDELKNKKRKPSIVICPSSLVLNWKSEVEKWCNEIKVLIIRGDAETRKSLIETYNDYDLIITSYDLLKRDVFEYEGKSFKYIIADEAQYIKNSITQNATSLKSLEGEIKFALTGTPIENSIAELWSIFDFIMPGYLYNYNKFKKKFEEPILKSEDTEALQRLKALINPFVLRRVKKDVLTELPEKNITIMNNEMTTEQEKIYLSYFAQTKKEVVQELSDNGFEKSKFKILMLLTRLRQICCHPSLFIENYKGGSGKLNQCIDIILDAIESGHKILLFSGYTSMFEIIEEKLNENKINYYKLTGSTPVNKRVEMVEQFNKDNNIKIFLISLKAGGTGLNLTGADVVIHYDPWWNLSSENQATDRAYRIGQKNSVQVYKLITTNSIEEKINKLQEKKAKLSEQLLSTEETFINKLSQEEIMSLFEE